MQFIYDRASRLSVFRIEDIDLDGFSTAKKSLSVSSDTSYGGFRHSLFVYLLGPYEFGGTTARTIFTNSGNPLAISIEYTVSPKRTCLNQCSSPAKGICVHYQLYLDYCQCNDGYINRDCSIQATELKIGQ